MAAKILIVDDDAISRELVAHSLATEGRSFVKVANGNEAVEVVDSQMLNLIILDLALPGKTGTEVLRYVRSKPTTKDIPVVIVSSRKGSLYQEALLAEGATAYFTKPLNLSDFRGAIQRAIGNS